MKIAKVLTALLLALCLCLTATACGAAPAPAVPDAASEMAGNSDARRQCFFR